MTTETDIRERVERAVAEDIEFTVASTDPLVLLAENADGTGDSSTPYTVVPNALHCGCPDDTFRGPICKHQLALALQDDWRGATMREAIGDEFRDVQDELVNAREQFEALKEQAEALNTVRREIGERTSPQPTDPENVRSDEEREQEAVEVAEEMAEVFDSETRRNNQQSGDVGEVFEEAGDEEAADGFREMVEDLSSERASASEEGGSSRAERGEDLSQ